MEEKELLELEKALRAATPAPWRTEWRSIFGPLADADRPERGDALVAQITGPLEDSPAIVLLRNAAPSLISEIRAARRFRQAFGLFGWPEMIRAGVQNGVAWIDGKQYEVRGVVVPDPHMSADPEKHARGHTAECGEQAAGRGCICGVGFAPVIARLTEGR